MNKKEHLNSELHCTNCGHTVMVRMHITDTGNLTIECPNCEHKHYRFVERGIITEDRWRSGGTWTTVTAAVWTTMTISTPTSTGTTFLRDSWINGTGTTAS